MRKHSIVRPSESLLPAIIGGGLNAITAWQRFRDQPSVPISVDIISSTEMTVFSEGVVLAFTLGFALTILDARGFRESVIKEGPPPLAALVRRPLFPYVIGLALQNALFLFGAFVVVAILWQRYVGTVYVAPLVAAVLVGFLAAGVSFLTDLRTKRAMLTPPSAAALADHDLAAHPT